MRIKNFILTLHLKILGIRSDLEISQELMLRIIFKLLKPSGGAKREQ